MKRPTMQLVFSVLILAAAFVVPSAAQDAQPNAGGRGAGGGGRGGDPAQWRQRMADRMKEELNANDDEWKVLQPKIEKVQSLQRDAGGFGGMGAMLGRGGRGGRGGENNNNNGQAPAAAPADAPPPSATMAKARDLRTVLENKDAKPEEIKSKLAALREARTQARESLKKARQDLTELVNTRQEAVLVEMGILE